MEQKKDDLLWSFGRSFCCSSNSFCFCSKVFENFSTKDRQNSKDRPKIVKRSSKDCQNRLSFCLFVFFCRSSKQKRSLKDCQNKNRKTKRLSKRLSKGLSKRLSKQKRLLKRLSLLKDCYNRIVRRFSLLKDSVFVFLCLFVFLSIAKTEKIVKRSSKIRNR